MRVTQITQNVTAIDGADLIRMYDDRRHRARIINALEETQTALARAERYSEDLRDHALISTYRQHIANLTARLEATA